MTDTQGKLLVAPPNIPDWRFQKTVIYVWRHDVSGAAGVIINKKSNAPDFKHICDEGEVKRKDDLNFPVYYGGPVLTNIVGILHSKDFLMGSTNTSDKQPLAFTLDRKMLEILAEGGGPKKKIVTLGLANWETNQLEEEIEALPPRKSTGSWLVIPYDDTLVFGPQREDMWEMCVSRAVESKTAELTGKYFKK